MASKKGVNRWLIGVGLLCVLSIAIFFATKEADTVLVTTVDVKEKEMKAYIDEQGYTSLPQIFHVTMPMQGRILPMSVTEGEKVEKNQTVAKLEDDDWLDAQLEVKSITETFQKWLEASAAQRKAAEIRLEFDKWNWERHKELAKDSAISEREQRDTKRNFLDSSVQAESSEALFFATKALESIIDLLPGYVQRNYDRTTVKSPVSGTVLKRHVWNEKVLTPGSPIIDIGNLEELEVTTEILTEEAVNVHTGDQVIIYGASLGTSILPGEVRLVEPNAFTKISSLGVEEQRVAVKIRFTEQAQKQIDKDSLNLGLGYRVRVQVITKEKSNTIAVPRTALFSTDTGEWQLYQVINGRAELTTVELGLVNDIEAEIVSGLSPQDTVISIPQANLRQGIEVKSLN